MKYTKTNTTITTTKIHLQNFSAGPVTSHNVETLSTIIICDVGPIKPTKPDIMTKILVFGSFCIMGKKRKKTYLACYQSWGWVGHETKKCNLARFATKQKQLFLFVEHL